MSGMELELDIDIMFVLVPFPLIDFLSFVLVLGYSGWCFLRLDYRSPFSLVQLSFHLESTTKVRVCQFFGATWTKPDKDMGFGV